MYTDTLVNIAVFVIGVFVAVVSEPVRVVVLESIRHPLTRTTVEARNYGARAITG